jgi:hypothetical protein
MIILDISANTTKNNNSYLKRMLDELKAVDSGKHEIVIKGQLFKECGENIPMTHEHFDYMHNYAKELGYKCTASVFDKESLDFLLTYDIPFVKIANREDLRYLIGDVPRKHRVYYSFTEDIHIPFLDCKVHGLFCISKYPTKVMDYKQRIPLGCHNISDHTSCWGIYKSHKWDVYECHYALEDSTGLDAECGICRTPTMLKEIL